MNNKITEIVLVFWAVVVVGSLAFSLYVLAVDGWGHAYSHFFIPAISLMWLLFRWGMYKKMKKHEQQK